MGCAAQTKYGPCARAPILPRVAFRAGPADPTNSEPCSRTFHGPVWESPVVVLPPRCLVRVHTGPQRDRLQQDTIWMSGAALACCLAANLVEAVAAVHRAIVARHERHLGLDAAAVADGGEELTRPSHASTIPRGPTSSPSRRTPGRGIGEIFGRIEGLLARGPDKVVPAVPTLQHLILVTSIHRLPPPTWLRVYRRPS